MTVTQASFDMQVRNAAMSWLDQISNDFPTFDELSSFSHAGHRIPLMDRQRGIRKPAILDAALSFRTSFTPPGAAPPYIDAEGLDGFLRYKYRGDDPLHPENVALRLCLERRLPLIWFVGIGDGRYVPMYPVHLIADEMDRLQFVVAVDPEQRHLPLGDAGTADTRRYVKRLTDMRMHQPVFRARVLQAYGRQCSVCQLKHVELLDAAHILSDRHPKGLPIVPNGLAMCKIHHAAFDQNIIGVRPDLIVEVRRDILIELDGPMLRHGLQEMAGVHLTVPRHKSARPNRENLEERYARFRKAAPMETSDG